MSAIGQRKELETALGFVRDGDTFVVTKLDQLARSTQHALNIVEGLENRGVGLRILDFAGEVYCHQEPSRKARADHVRSFCRVRATPHVGASESRDCKGEERGKIQRQKADRSGEDRSGQGVGSGDDGFRYSQKRSRSSTMRESCPWFMPVALMTVRHCQRPSNPQRLSRARATPALARAPSLEALAPTVCHRLASTLATFRLLR